MIKRIKKAWQLTKIPEIQDADTIVFSNSKEGKLYPVSFPVEGDGKAEFLGEGTVEEYKRQEERDKGFFDKVFGL